MAFITHSFQVQDETVQLADLNVEPVSLRSTFGTGATLALRQARNHHQAALPPNTLIAYKADGVTRFRGLIRSITRNTADDSITYQALDALARAASVFVNFDLPGSPSVGEFVTRALTEAGLPVGDGVSELGAVAPVSLPYSGSLSQALTDAMAGEPSYRLIVDPSSDTDLVDAVQVYQSGDTQTLSWGGVVDPDDPQPDLIGRVVNASLQESVDGTATAVELVQPDLKAGSATYDKTVTLQRAWLAEDEEDWYLEAVGVTTPEQASIGNDPGEKDFMVFRAFELASTIDDFDPEQPWKLMVGVDPDPRQSWNQTLYVPVEAEYFEVNRQKVQPLGPDVTTHRYVVAKHPVTTSGNVRVKGSARGPASVQLIYQATRGGGSFPASVRVPSAGFEGTAYTTYGVETVKRIETDDNANVTQGNAQRALDSLKDVVHTGLIQVYGNMPAWSWMGGSSVVLDGQNDTGTPALVDYAGVEFTQTGWTVDYRTSTVGIELTDNNSSYVNLDAIT